MRIFYTFFWICALPLVLARLVWRGRKEPGYRQHIAERFGLYPADRIDDKPGAALIWLHAVSVGETRAAEPLIRQLMQNYPAHGILLSHMTPTGRATGSALFQTEINANRLRQIYLPYDIPALMRRLLNHFNPDICILMETEVWPNLIHSCHQKNVPVALVNARLSPRSLHKAERLARLIRPAVQLITCVAAQTAADADRITSLGAAHVRVSGNTKFDVTIPAEKMATGHWMRQQWGNRSVLLCASTRDGEEELLLDAFIEAAIPDLLLIIVPRHPQRFDQVEQSIQQRGLTMQRRTGINLHPLEKNVRVVLGDSMGELVSYYVSCDIAYIGGSLLPLGGQNLIEACAVAKPVLIGPHTFNFEAVSADAIAAGAAKRIKDAPELFRATAALLMDQELRIAMGHSGSAFAQQHGGATERTVEILKPLMQ